MSTELHDVFIYEDGEINPRCPFCERLVGRCVCGPNYDPPPVCPTCHGKGRVARGRLVDPVERRET